MRRLLRLAFPLGIVAIMLAAPTGAGAQVTVTPDSSGANITLDFMSPTTGRQNTDMAFWGNTLVQGDTRGIRVFDITNPAAPNMLSDFACHGAYGDVSIWGNLVFRSVDRPQDSAGCGSVDTTTTVTPAVLTSAAAATAQATSQAPGWEGIQIINIADPANPQFVAGVPTDCGAHSNTIVPDLANNRVLLYVSSFPNTGFVSVVPAIEVENSALTVRQCVFRDQQSLDLPGSGISGTGSDLTVEDSVFEGNYLASLHAAEGSLTIVDSEFRDQRGSSVVYRSSLPGPHPVSIRGCRFLGNPGPAVSVVVTQASAEIRECRFEHGVSESNVGALRLGGPPSTFSYDVEACVFHDNVVEHLVGGFGGPTVRVAEAGSVRNCTFHRSRDDNASGPAVVVGRGPVPRTPARVSAAEPLDYVHNLPRDIA